MQLRLQFVVIALIAVMLFFVIRMTRKKSIDLRYSIFWIGLCVIIIVISLFPNTLEGMANVIGVELASNMVFMLAIILLVMITFLLTASISRLSTKTKRLTQEIALLKRELYKLTKAEVDEDN